jgi:hypothetical protein
LETRGVAALLIAVILRCEPSSASLEGCAATHGLAAIL